MMYYVYMLRCSDDSLYTGITPDPKHRMRQHLGKIKGGARYTKLRPPREMAALWSVPDKSTAAKAEYAIKRLSREEKQRLITAPGETGEFPESLAVLSLTPQPLLNLNEI